MGQALGGTVPPGSQAGVFSRVRRAGRSPGPGSGQGWHTLLLSAWPRLGPIVLAGDRALGAWPAWNAKATLGWCWGGAALPPWPGLPGLCQPHTGSPDIHCTFRPEGDHLAPEGGTETRLPPTAQGGRTGPCRLASCRSPLGPETQGAPPPGAGLAAMSTTGVYQALQAAGRPAFAGTSLLGELARRGQEEVRAAPRGAAASAWDPTLLRNTRPRGEARLTDHQRGQG